MKVNRYFRKSYIVSFLIGWVSCYFGVVSIVIDIGSSIAEAAKEQVEEWTR